MHQFRCHCGNTINFENSRCLVCGRILGFLPDQRILAALEPAGLSRWRPAGDEGGKGLYRACSNYTNEDVCNWMLPDADHGIYCQACRLNHMIPDLSFPQNRVLWARIERAKRRLLYTINGLGLRIITREEDPERGLAFDFLSDGLADAATSDHAAEQSRVLSGHRGGLITINILEADPGAREEIREKMGEQYRTLLGHFRHEIGHYYWVCLVRDTDWLQRFREVFGDERDDYDAALSRYYQNGPPQDWSQSFISAYASSHPWEDFAETWAHYLHMADTLETAHDFGFSLAGQTVRQPPAGAQLTDEWRTNTSTFESLRDDWIRLTLAMNALNRSMGLPDAYPFAIPSAAMDKLRFVHELVLSSTR